MNRITVVPRQSLVVGYFLGCQRTDLETNTPATHGCVVSNLRYDIEPLLTSRTESSHSGLWNDVEEEKGDAHVDEGLDIRGKENSLPRALERVFCWLEEVEAGHQNVRVHVL